MMNKLFAAFFIMFCFYNSNFAQEMEIFGIHATHFQSVEVEESQSNAEIGFEEYKAFFNYPIVKNNFKTIIVQGLEYNMVRAKIKTGVTSGNLSEFTTDFHSVMYNLRINQAINSKWRLALGISPTLASDFEGGISNDDLLMQSNVMLINTEKINFNYGLGFAYTSRFGRALIIPIGMLKYETKKMLLQATLPRNLTLTFFNRSKTFRYGVNAVLNGGLFNINDEISFLNTNIDEAGYSRMQLGAMFAVALGKNSPIYLKLNAGIAGARRMDFIDINNEVLERTPKSGGFVQVGFTYIPKTKKPTSTPEKK